VLNTGEPYQSFFSNPLTFGSDAANSYLGAFLADGVLREAVRDGVLVLYLICPRARHSISFSGECKWNFERLKN
jgi:hypothetical protein